MSIAGLNASSHYQLYQALTPGAINSLTSETANGATLSASFANTSVAPVANNSDNVSLSDAAQALQTTSISPAMMPEEQLLTTLADKSLAALGIVSTADESDTQVSFNSVSYSVVSSASSSSEQQQTSAGSQSIVQGAADNTLDLMGEGEIVTANGQDFQFQIELQLNQNAQVATDSDTANPQIADSQATLPSVPAAPASNQAGNNLHVSESSRQAYSLSLTPINIQPLSVATPATIDWDAVTKQTEALFAMLDALADLTDQAASTTTSTSADSSSAAATTASSSLATATSATSADSTAAAATTSSTVASTTATPAAASTLTAPATPAAASTATTSAPTTTSATVTPPTVANTNANVPVTAD